MGRFYKTEEFKPIDFGFKLPADLMFKVKAKLDQEMEDFATNILPIDAKASPLDAETINTINANLMSGYNDVVNAMQRGELDINSGMQRLRKLKLERSTIANYKPNVETSHQNYSNAVKQSKFTSFYDESSFYIHNKALGKYSIGTDEDGNIVSAPQDFVAVDFQNMLAKSATVVKILGPDVLEALNPKSKKSMFGKFSGNDPSGVRGFSIKYSDPDKLSTSILSGYEGISGYNNIKNIVKGLTQAYYDGDAEKVKKLTAQLKGAIDDDKTYEEILNRTSDVSQFGNAIRKMNDYFDKAEQAFKEGRITEEEYNKVQRDKEEFRNTLFSVMSEQALTPTYAEQVNYKPQRLGGQNKTEKRQKVIGTNTSPNTKTNISNYENNQFLKNGKFVFNRTTSNWFNSENIASNNPNSFNSPGAIGTIVDITGKQFGWSDKEKAAVAMTAQSLGGTHYLYDLKDTYFSSINVTVDGVKNAIINGVKDKVGDIKSLNVSQFGGRTPFDKTIREDVLGIEYEYYDGTKKRNPIINKGFFSTTKDYGTSLEEKYKKVAIKSPHGYYLPNNDTLDKVKIIEGDSGYVLRINKDDKNVVDVSFDKETFNEALKPFMVDKDGKKVDIEDIDEEDKKIALLMYLKSDKSAYFMAKGQAKVGDDDSSGNKNYMYISLNKNDTSNSDLNKVVTQYTHQSIMDSFESLRTIDKSQFEEMKSKRLIPSDVTYEDFVKKVGDMFNSKINIGSYIYDFKSGIVVKKNIEQKNQ